MALGEMLMAQDLSGELREDQLPRLADPSGLEPFPTGDYVS